MSLLALINKQFFTNLKVGSNSIGVSLSSTNKLAKVENSTVIFYTHMIFLWSTYTVFHSNVNAFNFTQWIERSSKCTRTNKDRNGFLYIVLKDEDKQTIISRAVCSFALKKGSVPDPDLELRGGWPGFFEILKPN